MPGLSHTIITSGAIASCGFGLAQRSPVDPDKPLMSFDIALTLVPAMLFGVSFVSFWVFCSDVQQPSQCAVTPHNAWCHYEQVLGIVTHHGSNHAGIVADAEWRRHGLQGVLVAPVIPEWLQTALLTVLLAYVASKTLAKGQKQFQKERSSAQATPQPAVQCACACPFCLMFIVCNASSYLNMDRHGCTRHTRRHELLLSPCAPPCSIHLDACSWASCCLLATG